MTTIIKYSCEQQRMDYLIACHFFTSGNTFKNSLSFISKELIRLLLLWDYFSSIVLQTITYSSI
jgi:hypothetical protein